ncbi:MAG: HD domain-containing protein [Tenericutes bacterium]|nr:HD domain-containing protein [Mycoplasmatota bacterium]
MNIKDKAKQFAIKAHQGQIRKNEPDKPMIMHPISVGMLLEGYGYDDEIVAAGYLHDVVEDTKYTLEDLEKEFGSSIASYVQGASEPDKSLSWQERKTHTINEIKNLPLKNKLVICADKINNLEDLMLVFQKSGIRNFSRFKAGEELQKWYYTNVYKSLILNQNKDLAIFKKLKEVLDIVFYKKKDTYLEEIFINDMDYYKKLINLHSQKIELQRLKAMCNLPKPFVIEFCGTPRTGKTTVLNNLYDFFTKGGFSVNLVKEFTTSSYYKTILNPQMKNNSKTELNIAIIKEVEKQLYEAVSKKDEIILIDRSLNDRAIWNYRNFISNHMSEEQYKQVTEYYSKISKEMIDMLIINYTDSKTALKRDYINSLALEERKFLNIKNITEYNKSMEKLELIFKKSVDTVLKIDTTNITPRDTAVLIAEKVMPIMRKQYIKSFNENINKNC